ncbi:MAG TPA: carbohydrate kinase [Candidatus Aphodoplasma excrementigallinarum]|uniref:Carbohydrate kinase n=1 Tax=Candidatus Aphodoplasma excrementigallinarum TaxID=2840673 RepID=A0A9D1NJ68_9FIRM|nr:carbohydrate kinase [Candidatus Aphodoplasma excrementigallinarum]
MMIGGLDVGTTGCKLALYHETGEFVSRLYKEYDVSRINGEHEIDAEAIFAAVCELIRAAAAKYADLAAIGVTTFGESFVLLGKDDRPLLPAMLYTDPRGGGETQALCETLGEDTLIQIAGVKPHQMYSLPKMMWLKKHRPQIFSQARRVMLMEDYLIYMLTGAAQIDDSLAARTMAFDIRKKCWSGEIFAAAGITPSLMSKPVPSGTTAGKIRKSVKDRLGISGDIIVVNGAHDQAAAAVGAGVFAPGQAVDGTGTVECVTPVFDTIPENRQLYTEGYSAVPYIGGKYVCYALSYTGGAALKWYRDNFAKYESKLAKQTGENVYDVLNSNIKDGPTGLLVLPYFAGAANPYMDNDAKAVIAGLTLEHTCYDVYRALMEGVTYEIMLNLEHLSRFGITPTQLYAAGGGAASDQWLQIKADILRRPITALDAPEAGACGVCMLSSVAIGLCGNLNEARARFVKPKKTFTPNAENVAVYKKLFEKYKRLYPMMKSIMGDGEDDN